MTRDKDRRIRRLQQQQHWQADFDLSQVISLCEINSFQTYVLQFCYNSNLFWVNFHLFVMFMITCYANHQQWSCFQKNSMVMEGLCTRYNSSLKASRSLSCFFLWLHFTLLNEILLQRNILLNGILQFHFCGVNHSYILVMKLLLQAAIT